MVSSSFAQKLPLFKSGENREQSFIFCAALPSKVFFELPSGHPPVCSLETGGGEKQLAKSSSSSSDDVRPLLDLTDSNR